MQNVTDPEQIPFRWLSRGLMLLLVAVGLYLIRKSWAAKGRIG